MLTMLCVGALMVAFVCGFFWSLRNIPDSDPEYVYDLRGLVPEPPRVEIRQTQSNGDPPT